MGGGFRMVRQVPVRFQRRLPQAAPLSPEAQYRLRCLEHADRTSVREASRAFQVPVSTIYRWRRRFRPDDLTTLEPRSRRPHRTRRATWTAAQESAVLALRQQHPRMGKGPLRVLLAQQGHHLSASMIGRMLGSLRRRTLLREPHTVRVRRERPQRPYATRVPKDKRTPTEPGALVQLDTMHLRPLPGVERRQFTAIDVVSRCAVAGVRATASAGTATAFLDELLARMPVPVQAILKDTVVHFKAEFQLFKLSIEQGNLTAANALGRRLNRMTPWISRSEPEISEFLRLYAIHRKPKQRGVANVQPDHLSRRNSESSDGL
jgi:transposase